MTMPPKDDFLMQFLEAKFAALNQRLDRVEGIVPRIEAVERDIAKYKNRALGFLIGGAGGGASFGAWVSSHLPNIGKLFS